MPVHRTALTLTGLATALALTACGAADDSGSRPTTGASASSPAPASAPNDADVTLAQLMTVHHEQAVEMAALAADRSGTAEVRDLAARIEAAQGPEITTLTGWLDDWGAAAPGPGGGHGGHGSETMPGDMSAEEMDRLTDLSGSAFDREFLTMMISHHEGAVDMAETQQAEGAHPDAVALAAEIVADQTAEIEEMRALLDQ